MRPRICAAPRGCKATLSAELLGIGSETLRYWREHLDPNPSPTYFSGGRLLAYRVLKVLIRHHFIPVEALQRCNRSELFECCEHVATNVLERSFLYIDPRLGRLSLHEECPLIDDDNIDAQVIPLKGIVRLHRLAWERLGFPAPRQQLRPVELLSVAHRH